MPDQLPPELVPPSHKDLGDSVTFLKDLLKNDTNVRSTSGIDFNTGERDPISYLPTRSFRDSPSSDSSSRRDATIYRHEDKDPGTYKSSNRHFDRNKVRFGDESPSSDLSDIKRQLENTNKMLDKARSDQASRTAEDDALDQEMDDLKFRVRRIQDDIEYVSRGPRSASKDEERRKLERDLLYLLHEKVPDVEKKIEERDRRKQREKDEWARDRDRRNDRYGGKYDDDKYSSSRYGSEYDRRDRDRDDRRDDGDRGYQRGTFDRDDRSYGRDRDEDRDRERDRDYDRDRDRDRPSERTRTPPAKARSPPPSSSPVASAPPGRASPAPRGTTPAPPKSMTPEEKAAFIRAQAQLRLQERMKALGVAGTSTTTVDTTVEDRLAKERQEAEEKAKQAEAEAEERDKVRRQRLEDAKALKSGSTPAPVKPATPAPPPAAPAPPIAAPAPAARAAPAPRPVARQAAPPPPTRTNRPGAVPARASPAAAPPASSPSFEPPPVKRPIVDEEDEEIKRRETALQERAARLAELERQEEQARLQEEQMQARRQAFLDAKNAAAQPAVQAPPQPPPATRAAIPPPNRARASPLPPPAKTLPPPSPAPPTPRVEPVAIAPPAAEAPPPPPPPPPAPPAPPVAASATSPPVTSPGTGASTNPFHLMSQKGTPTAQSATSPSANGASTNPFFNRGAPAAAAPAVAPPAVATPPVALNVPKPGPYNKAPGNESDDWDEIEEKEDEDSSDDEYTASRGARNALAGKLFSGLLPTSRPTSAAANSSPATPATPAAPPPAAPAPPPPPSAPATPPMLSFAAPTAVPADRGSLLSAIAGGARLKKTVTIDKSAPPVSGKVLGDPSAPVPAYRPPSPPSPPPAPRAVVEEYSNGPASQPDQTANNRQSVDWYAGLATDGIAKYAAEEHLASHAEVDEEEESYPTIPNITIDEHVDANHTAQAADDESMADIDLTTGK
jgi:hypothetical protein